MFTCTRNVIAMTKRFILQQRRNRGDMQWNSAVAVNRQFSSDDAAPAYSCA